MCKIMDTPLLYVIQPQCDDVHFPDCRGKEKILKLGDDGGTLFFPYVLQRNIFLRHREISSWMRET